MGTCKTSAGFTKEIPLKLNRTEKKVYQKIELTFNFTKEIHVKIRQKKINPEILPQIYREIPLQNFYKEKSLQNVVAFQKSREFYKGNPFKFFFRKKSSPKFSQISAAKLTSWTPFLKKITVVV